MKMNTQDSNLILENCGITRIPYIEIYEVGFFVTPFLILCSTISPIEFILRFSPSTHQGHDCPPRYRAERIRLQRHGPLIIQIMLVR